jgi:hypothetical protein
MMTPVLWIVEIVNALKKCVHNMMPTKQTFLFFAYDMHEVPSSLFQALRCRGIAITQAGSCQLDEKNFQSGTDYLIGGRKRLI